MTGRFLEGVAPVTARQFAIFRIAFGVYLAVHFVHLIPWGAELFSTAGVLPDPRLNPTYGILPNVLAAWSSPQVVTLFLGAMVTLAVLFAAGIARRPVAVLLWYGWACLFNRNVLIANPSIPYVGLLLLLTALVPASESWRTGTWLRRRFGVLTGRAEPFAMPMMVWGAAWALMAVGYTFSGVVKLASPSWADGTAFLHVVNNPLARPGPLRDFVASLPGGLIQLLTWQALALEVLFLPLALWRVTRALAWGAMIAMHTGIVALVSFADLSVGMLMLHLFTFDPRWMVMARAVRARLTRPAATRVMTEARTVQ